MSTQYEVVEANGKYALKRTTYSRCFFKLNKSERYLMALITLDNHYWLKKHDLQFSAAWRHSKEMVEQFKAMYES